MTGTHLALRITLITGAHARQPAFYQHSTGKRIHHFADWNIRLGVGHNVDLIYHDEMGAEQIPVFLIHWKLAEGSSRLQDLLRCGFAAEQGAADGPSVFREMRRLMPAAVVIDLSRMPSHGREVAVAMRNAKWSRDIPIVFAGGEPEKVKAIRRLLPDAVYSGWDEIEASVRSSIAAAPAMPERPLAMMDSFAASPLVKKLAIKPGMKVQLIAAPEGFTELLGELTQGVDIREATRGAADMRIWFVRSMAELDTRILAAAANSKGAPLWIAYPKKTSRLASNLTQQDVREAGLAAGIVDYKVCAIDADWTGLLFCTKQK